ncbi:AraC family transcriptional regulator [Mangrovimicrobium sediminis]|uniref:AraC family transcriptional regulator n=1 Tax=Mangrovimicrobium sediminis TaxID=2562682 RepID=A0A4Z0LXA1_9GAMM|nr:AraC family transcriptional regulator [Haliea sp. SAOS-164]TGD71705.1 AraC family transcriptional regulator [Haliea sp. SAOS-164]
MQQIVEKQLALDEVSVHLETLRWEGVESMPAYSGYRLSQRLSDTHSPLRIGNADVPEVLPRVRSVGLLPPGRSIRMFPVEAPLRIVYCVFDERWFEDATGYALADWERHIGSLVLIRNPRLELLMQDIHAEMEQPGFGHEQLIAAAARLLVVELGRFIRELEARAGGQGEGPGMAPWQLRRVQDRIEASLELGYPGLGELAELCGISQGHLARSFKASTGWQIHKYIAEQRLRSAQVLLAQPALSCEEIAQRLGFKSPAYFSTVFRRMTGRTPTEYRRQALAATPGVATELAKRLG